jgi:hypothetical protein
MGFSQSMSIHRTIRHRDFQSLHFLQCLGQRIRSPQLGRQSTSTPAAWRSRARQVQLQVVDTLDVTQHDQGLFGVSIHLDISIGFKTSGQGARNHQRPQPRKVNWNRHLFAILEHEIELGDVQGVVVVVGDLTRFVEDGSHVWAQGEDLTALGSPISMIDLELVDLGQDDVPVFDTSQYTCGGRGCTRTLT